MKARNDKLRFLLLMSTLFLVPLLTMLAGPVSPYCYRIIVDGKDRSAYQYVNQKLVAFADPSWQQDPAIEEVHLIDLKTGPKRPPVIQRANYISSRPWGGVMFQHIPEEKVLNLRAGGRRISFQRRNAGAACPHPDFRLDNRLLGYEVLQHCPFEMYIGLGALGSRIHLEGQEVILKTVLLFTQCTATLNSARTDWEKPFPIQHFGGRQLIERYPHLSKVVNEQWGLLNTYLVFPVLSPGDELKVVVTLPGGGRQIPLYLRKIEENVR
jgi:hypothetical protein